MRTLDLDPALDPALALDIPKGMPGVRLLLDELRVELIKKSRAVGPTRQRQRRVIPQPRQAAWVMIVTIILRPERPR